MHLSALLFKQRFTSTKVKKSNWLANSGNGLIVVMSSAKLNAELE